MKVNWYILLASVFLSLLFWLHVQSEQALRVARPMDIALQPVQLDDTRFTVRSIPTDIKIFAEGTLENLERLRTLLKAHKNDLSYAATVDLRDAKPDVSSYRVRLPQNSELSRLDIDWGDVPEVPIVIQEVQSKQFPVDAAPANVPDGFVYSLGEVTPRSVTLHGVPNDLSRVHVVRAVVNLTEYRPGERVSCKVEVLDDAMKPLYLVRASPETVTVLPVLAQTPPERSLVVVARFAPGTQPSPGYRFVGYTISPLTVTVLGDLKAVGTAPSVPTQPIRLDGLRSRTTKRVRLLLPRGLRTKTDHVDVTLLIEPIPAVANPVPVNPTPNTTAPPPVTGN